MTIREIRPADLEFAAACTAREGWLSETRSELANLFDYNRAGCLICDTSTGPAGICFAICYGDVGFIGELIVLPERRGNGIGQQLMERSIEFLHKNGAARILLDAVPRAVALYERLGFQKLCRSLRFLRQPLRRSRSSSAKLRAHNEMKSDRGIVRAMSPVDLAAVNHLDQYAFGADRSFFLSRRLRDNPELCFVQERDGRISGFVTGRAGDGVYSAGPWVGKQGAETGCDLLHALAEAIPDHPLRIGVLSDNEAAVAALLSIGFEKQADSPWRMILGDGGYPETLASAFAIGSPAKG